MTVREILARLGLRLSSDQPGGNVALAEAPQFIHCPPTQADSSNAGADKAAETGGGAGAVRAKWPLQAAC